MGKSVEPNTAASRAEDARQSSWQVEQRPAELVFRRDINGRRVVVYYREIEDCRWYVFCPDGEDFESKGTAPALTTALTAAEAAAEGGR
jgi:hypothetical protein